MPKVNSRRPYREINLSRFSYAFLWQQGKMV
jgi:hypothetical protein